ncbi:hypothetical protein [Hymenobacter sp. CRA2]|uniref:hypothetical protein n=1 Tax=Hymenobacter sp. CRA2 TaxID=1955620 RepID=UPI00098FED83|nr:hypothetical protein [Hymenobacter sp. CRA2]OON66226.1 hypothetical protein B0919_22320 [Hymenobacter sp. CRA2]
MTASSSKPLPPASEAAVLLVLLPVARPEGQPTTAALEQLQHRLGSSIRVLKINEASHPTVVHSFHATELPACVLVQQGIELWRHSGLPDEAVTASLLEQFVFSAGVSAAKPLPKAQPA